MDCQNTFENGQPELLFTSNATDNVSLPWLISCLLEVLFFNQYPKKTFAR